MFGEVKSLIVGDREFFNNLKDAPDLRVQLYAWIGSHYILNPVGTETKPQLEKRIVEVFMDRWMNVTYDPNIGTLTLEGVINDLSPTSVSRNAPSNVKDASKSADANVSGITSDDLRKIADSLFKNGADAYAAYLDMERAKLNNKPVKLPNQLIVDYDIPRDYTWAWVIGGVAVVGLAALAMSRPRYRRSALPSAHAGPTMDLKAVRVG
jgi:hypothetical protein